mmetsp:Transcript_36055/g.94957  ORF Transcript_36055/g.94957 Transcript_36055/m.94957 type:complete len:753 (+) Transcript_36055:87-2345(+)|eukprot:CAMPEP_0115845776 /NCGR_PEP_ID=MMETSP0287-20121206/9528_1 /TAXON_ID=412157 /ORGANISM="Chrysochromulina rotalis, Strain UIO044" /LENGTH=752 /DNA_ID=CAMNT_0003299563 /DNA_START=71 /DNA_END=2329 /DNA_ORIENTATION=+
MTDAELTFSAEFDGGNLGRVEHLNDGNYVMWARADCEGTPQETKSRTWFYFAVRGAIPGQTLNFHIHMSAQPKLYEHGMRPVYRSLPSQCAWKRVNHTTCCNMVFGGPTPTEGFAIHLRHTVDTPPNEALFFAFCYPINYGDLMARLAWLDGLFCQPRATLTPNYPPLSKFESFGDVGREDDERGRIGSEPDRCDGSTMLNSPDGNLTALSSESASALTSLEVKRSAVRSGTTEGYWQMQQPPAVLHTHHAHLMVTAQRAAIHASKPINHQRLTDKADVQAWRNPAAVDNSPAGRRIPSDTASAFEAQTYPALQTTSCGTSALVTLDHPAPLVQPPHPDVPDIPRGQPTDHVAQALQPDCLNLGAVLSVKQCPIAVALASELSKAAAVEASDLLPHKQPCTSSGENLVYYKRDLLCRSLQGRRVDILTVTGHPHPHPNPPDTAGKAARHRKMVILMSARVHPGETPSSHVIDGILMFLLRADDPRADALRQRFVFKLIPMLNPDGVYHGNYRADTRGVNLNRTYAKARPDTHPSVAALLQLVRKLHADGDLALYIDIHAHAGRRGCFFYGNQLDDWAERVESVLYAKLVALNTRWFDYEGCNWFQTSADGSARSSVYAATKQQGRGLPLVFTLECNYDSGVAANELLPRYSGTPEHRGLATGRMSPEAAPPTTISPKYSPASWQDVGKALILAMLDRIPGANPASRLGPSCVDHLHKLRSVVAASLQKRERSKKPPRAPNEDDSAGEEDAAS